MKTVIFTFSLFLSSLGFGQVWIDSHAVWTYEIHSEYNPGYYEYHYDEDTLIMGQLCQKITGVRQLWYLTDDGDYDMLGPITLSNNYTYVSGDTVFYFFNDQFFVLYDFGASVGDQWMIADTNLLTPFSVCNDTAFVEVIETGTMDIAGETYRTITLQSPEDGAYALNGLFVERFGFIPDSSKWRMGPLSQTCDVTHVIQPWYVTFRCFHDDSFATYNPSGEDCLYHPSSLGLTSEPTPLLNIYPNPAMNELHLTTASSGTAQLFNSIGEEIQKFIIQGNASIDTSTLPSGLYYLMFTDESDQMDVFPVVINH